MRDIPSVDMYRDYRQIVTVVSCNYGFSQSQIRQGTFVYDSRIVEGDAFQVGTAIADEITVELDNTTGVYGKNAIGEEFEIYLSATDGVNETDRYLLGTFICVDAEENSSVISTLKMQDKMVLFDKVIPSFTAATLRKNLADFCDELKVPVKLTDEEDAFLRTLFVWSTANEQGITYRDFIRGIALIMCENAYITNNGYLAFKSVADYGETFTASERFTSEVGEKVKIGGLIVADDDGTVLYNGGIDDANNIVIDPSSSVIIDLIGGLSALVGKYEIQATLPIPGRAIFGREYYPVSMTTLNWWEIETGDIFRYVAKGGEVYSGIVTSCASVLNGKTSITSVADTENRDVPMQTDAIRTMNKALSDAADDASKVATNYLTFSQQNGLDVGYNGTLAKTRINGSGVEIFDAQGWSMEYIGSQNNRPYTRLGYALQGHIETSDGGLILKFGDRVLGRLGWGTTNPSEYVEEDTSLTIWDEAAYYTFGTRAESYTNNDGDDFDAVIGSDSFSIGRSNVAAAANSFVAGYGNVADIEHQTVIGFWNDPDEHGTFVVGGGSNPAIGQRANILVVGGDTVPVMIHGNTYVDGNITATPKSESRTIETVSGVTVGSLKIYTTAGLAMLTLEVTLTATVSDWTTIASGLPLPAEAWYDTAETWNTAYKRGLRVQVTTAGNLRIHYGESGTYRISMTYPLSTAVG